MQEDHIYIDDGARACIERERCDVCGELVLLAYVERMYGRNVQKTPTWAMDGGTFKVLFGGVEGVNPDGGAGFACGKCVERTVRHDGDHVVVGDGMRVGEVGA